MSVQITDSAYRRARELAFLEEVPGYVLKISVNGGGCSGFIYDYKMVLGRADGDLVFEKDGGTITIDPLSIEYMNGSVIDFVEELGSSYFAIKNPQAASKCGCGNSFSL